MGLCQGSPICLEGAMRQSQSTVSAKYVSRSAVQWLMAALQWSAVQTSVAPELLMQFLVRAAAEMRSLSAIVLESAAGPCYETVRVNLLRLLPADPMDLLPATTRALQAR